MKSSQFDERDLKDIRARGISPEDILKQIDIFRKGFSYANLLRPCRIDDGIKSLDNNDILRLNDAYEKAQSNGRAMKFVPASGAATRMFKELTHMTGQLEALDKDAFHESSRNNGDAKYLLSFIENIKKFPFYNDLESIMSTDGIDINKYISYGDYKDILDYTLGEKGLNLASLPKGLISFHQYPGYSRTPVEEHLVEAGAYTVDGDGKTRVHFTVSIEHEEAFRNHIEHVKNRYENSELYYEITFCNQKPFTDTIAVDMDNKPFRDSKGGLLFRQGGHGALIENLRDLNGDIIFIKNIDNIAPDRFKEVSYIYKKALAGYLVQVQAKIFTYLKRLVSRDGDEGFLHEIFDFIKSDLSISPPHGMENLSDEKKGEYLFSMLNRPLRVCGMVKNQAEPGGGPFWIRHDDGSISIQIVEKSQINMASEEQRRILEASTHFNPVDLVCGVRDYKGRNFDLKKYVDPETCFISTKSKDGVELKALELPGLWNGAMAFWNTIFIEVPLITFNPVKTIFDLLRNEHQPEEIVND